MRRRRHSTASTLAAAITLGACGGGDAGPPDANRVDAAHLPAHFSATWHISRDGSEVACSELDQPFIGIEIVPADAFIGTTDSFDCAPGMGLSADVDPGRYHIKFTLIEHGHEIAQAPEFVNIDLKAGMTTELAAMDFVLPAP